MIIIFEKDFPLRILIALFLLLVAGCAQTPKKPIASPPAQNASQIEQSWQRHQQQLTRIDHWHATGRLAVSQGQKGNNASFVWEQKGDSYQITLFGPFGAGAVTILGSPHYVEIQERNGKTTRAQSPELLLQKIAGWQVPLTGLRYWLRGLPAPSTGSTPAHQLDNRGFLSHLEQQGWHVDYENYLVDNVPPLPRKLQLQNKDLKIKMIVTSWKN